MAQPLLTISRLRVNKQREKVMQSLVLATSILLSSQSPVIATDLREEVAAFVATQANKVTQFVQYKEQLAAQDTFLYQAKTVINQAKQERAALLTTELAAEE